MKKNTIPERKVIIQDVIDASLKKKISVIQAPLLEDQEQLLNSVKLLNKSLEDVLHTYYSSNAAVERIQARDFKDIVEAKIGQLNTRVLAKLSKDKA